MNAHTLRVLEYEPIKTMLAGYASCELGKRVVAGLEPSCDEEAVRRALQETSEAQRLTDIAGSIPLGGVHDVREAVRAAAMGSLLEATTLLSVADTFGAARRLRAFVLKREEEAPRLAERARHLGDFSAIEDEIRRCINERGEVVDAASSTLSRLRKEMKIAHGRMMERLNSYLRNSGYRDMIQDPVITVRDDRYCIPVKAEYRTMFGGLVHDQSSSGSTVFMEPTAVVELGNELRQLALKERAEVERILADLAGRIGARAPEATVTLEVLGEIDFVAAKAKLGFALRCSEPVINNTGVVTLRQARHPLLRGDVVPIDVRLGEAFTELIITGPNTGGKTVTLKTVGLLSLMAQSGLHIPAESGSTLPIFRGIFADIGDEQSIQQSLSTFSGHITNIAAILSEVEKIGRRCLVLLDELGAGTDPMQGAALAKSLLTRLLQTGVRCIATTHYGELKEFAYSHEGVENASVEFDLETLRPTYRLLIGIPGSSNAFTIAARLGLPAEIVEAARGMMGTEQAMLTDVIQRLTADQRATEADQQRAASAARDVELIRERLERERRQLRVDREQALEQARTEAAEILQKARREADQAIAELKRREREARRGERVSPEQARTQMQRIAKRLEQSAPPPPEPREAPPVEETIATAEEAPRPGEKVLVTTFGQQGVLLAEPEAGKAPVQIGAMRVTVPYASLKKVLERRKPSAPVAGLTDMRLAARRTASPEVKLLGMRAEEALEALDEYMDTACLAGISPVRIVHGIGTGALKRVVWDYLQRHPHVARYRLGEDGEGGGGVTVVDLRE